MSRSGWWATRVRQFRAYLGAGVAESERAGLATWLTTPQLDVFDAMHVADQRHGLDVVATLRAEGGSMTSCSSPACSTTAARDPTSGYGRGSPGRSARRSGAWIPASTRRLPGFRPALDQLRDHAERSAELAAAAGCAAGPSS